MKTYTHWKHTLYICIYCILCSCYSYSQGTTKSLQTLEVDAKNSAKDIKYKVKDLDSEEAEKAYLTYKSTCKKLFMELEDANTEEMLDAEYAKSIEKATFCLYELSINDASSEEYIEAFNAIVKDYNTKINTMDAAVANSFAKIEVKVHAKSGQDLLQGYDVTYDYVWDASTPIHRFKSNNQTDNASLLLAPGWYIIYISKDGAITKQREVNIQYNDDPDKIEEIIFIL